MLSQSILFTKEECDYLIGLKNKYPLQGDNGRWEEFDDFGINFIR